MIRSLKRLPPVLSSILLLVALVWMNAPYLIVQASFIIRDLFGARTFDAVRQPTPEEEVLFARARAIREFGVQNLELSDTRAFVRYKRVDRQALVWVVSGVGELRWERYLWPYPVLGELPYRGYYREEDARREVERLKRSGYDALSRRVTAFSFLGFLPDPLYSFALERSHAALAELILHEMTHATLFVRGQGSFNENLASFVGTEGARQLIEEIYGANSPEYLQMIARREDLETARLLFRELHEELVSFYESLPADAPGTEAQVQKRAIFSRFQQRLAADYDTLFQTDGFRWLSDRPLNNAVVDLYLTYGSDLDVFEELLAARDGSIPRLLADLWGRRSSVRRRGMDALRLLLP